MSDLVQNFKIMNLDTAEVIFCYKMKLLPDQMIEILDVCVCL